MTSIASRTGREQVFALPVGYLSQCFTLDPETPSGLCWRERPREHFETTDPSAHAWEAWSAVPTAWIQTETRWTP
jgi:hypothetical protein